MDVLHQALAPVLLQIEWLKVLQLIVGFVAVQHRWTLFVDLDPCPPDVPDELIVLRDWQALWLLLLLLLSGGGGVERIAVVMATDGRRVSGTVVIVSRRIGRPRRRIVVMVVMVAVRRIVPAVLPPNVVGIASKA